MYQTLCSVSNTIHSRSLDSKPSRGKKAFLSWTGTVRLILRNPVLLRHMCVVRSMKVARLRSAKATPRIGPSRVILIGVSKKLPTSTPRTLSARKSPPSSRENTLLSAQTAAFHGLAGALSWTALRSVDTLLPGNMLPCTGSLQKGQTILKSLGRLLRAWLLPGHVKMHLAHTRPALWRATGQRNSLPGLIGGIACVILRPALVSTTRSGLVSSATRSS